MKTVIAFGAAFGLAGAAMGVGGTEVQIDISGINSWDLQGAIDNEALSVDLASALGLAPGSAVSVTGIGWDVNLSVSANGSWYNEAQIGFGDTFGTYDLFLTPGTDGENGTDTRNYSSGGILKLADVNIPDLAISDGVIEMEFFESFDDVSGEIDGTWEAGSIITLQVVPAPGALALMGLAGLAGRRRRRG